MTSSIRAVLVTGPAGSGKSTLAAQLTERLVGWRLLSEDDYWARHGWFGLRTPEQEDLVQAEVGRDLLAAQHGRRGVVVEFIVYKRAPNALTAYRAALDAAGVAHATIVLAPPVEVIIERMRARGRAGDLADLDRRRAEAKQQLDCLGDEIPAADLVVADDPRTPAEIVDAWVGDRLSGLGSVSD
jgi:adenylate kinase family enzyme